MMNLYYPDPVVIYKAKRSPRAAARASANSLRRLTEQRTRAMTPRVKHVFQALQQGVPLYEIEDAIKTGRAIRWDTVVGNNNIRNAGGSLRPVIRNTMIDAGFIAERRIPTIVNAKVRFDISQPRIQNWIDENAGLRIQGVTDEIKAATDAMVRESYENSLPPRRSAKIVRESIGVDERQARGLMNYQIKLEQQGVTGDDLIRRVSARREQYINDRSYRIARTETANAVNAGHQVIWEQAVEDGHVDKDQLKRRWVTYPTQDSAWGCLQNDGEVVGLDEPWRYQLTPDSPVEYLMVPSQSHPNCNCLFEVITEGI